MIRTLRAFFLSRALREKLLIVAILGVAVVMSASAYSSRVSALWRAYSTTTAELTKQKNTLSQRATIEAVTQEAAAQMDPAKTLDLAELNIAISQFAQEAGITPNISPSGGALTSGRFSVHPLTVGFANVNWNSFVDFYRKVQSRAPYIVVTELVFQPAANNSAQIRGSMRVQSFEIRQ